MLDEQRRIVLLLDNVHTPVGLELTRLLMESPRPWRIWAAARSQELAESTSTGLENPWSEEDYVRDACDLVGAKEIDFTVNAMIAPI